MHLFTSMDIHKGETNMKDLFPNKDKSNFKMKFTLDELWKENWKEGEGLLKGDVFANVSLIEPGRTI